MEESLTWRKKGKERYQQGHLTELRHHDISSNHHQHINACAQMALHERKIATLRRNSEPHLYWCIHIRGDL